MKLNEKEQRVSPTVSDCDNRNIPRPKQFSNISSAHGQHINLKVAGFSKNGTEINISRTNSKSCKVRKE